MKLIKAAFGRIGLFWFQILFLLPVCMLLPVSLFAQAAQEPFFGKEPKFQFSRTPVHPQADETDYFRVEKVRMSGGSEIITLFGKAGQLNSTASGQKDEIPLVSVLRDTLGDSNPENDRIRYIWSLTYTRPTKLQKLAAFVPFLYSRTINRGDIGSKEPPPIIDLNSPKSHFGDRLFRLLFEQFVLRHFGFGLKASAVNYFQNTADYRRAAIARAFNVFSIYDSTDGEKSLRDSELREIQSSLLLTDRSLGSSLHKEKVQQFYDKNVIEQTRDIRGHNWELLRQYSEEQGLYFKPVEMVDGSATDALVWVSQSDIATKKREKFDSRFLNFANPWTDPELMKWNGYSEVWWFDKDSHQVSPNTPGAMPRTMIPLAVYGLDHPKIPILLVDFRSSLNVKKREMSRRLMNDLSNNLLSIFQTSDLPYFAGKFAFSFFTRRKGINVDQVSRVRSYSQLKLLLSIDSSLDPRLKHEISKRVEAASLNPFENDLVVESKIANVQYKSLMAFAKRPDGLPAMIEKDRRQEMVRIVHGSGERKLLSLAHFVTFGLYTHREKEKPEMIAKLGIRRQLDYDEAFLRQVAETSVKPEVDSDIAALRRALEFVSVHGAAAKSKTSIAIAKIFSSTDDYEARSFCLSGLYKINNSTAKKELLSLYNKQKIDDPLRGRSAEYLKLALQEKQRISASDAVLIAEIDNTGGR